MTDPRLTKLADNLIRYSCRIKPGEKVLIETHDCPDEVAEELILAVYRAGGLPFVETYRPKVRRALLNGATEELIEAMTRFDEARMRQMDAFISFRGNDNSMELADVPMDKMQLYNTVYAERVHHRIRVKDTKWVVLRYPNSSMAQLAGMSTRAFEDYYFDVCTLDYGKMDRAMDVLSALMDKTDKVRITAPGTDITFSIKDIPAVKCSGHMNIPDGELYTAPVRTSVNGRISFNTPSIENGFKFENISFLFKEGKIIEATANDTERINGVLNTDEGARYVGEFSLGINPYILHPMCDTLFDEKIAGSIHFTPGSCYEDADNGNKSAIHWDLVLIQRPEYGGGDIWFDDKLIRHDGLFVPEELSCLNPEELK